MKHTELEFDTYKVVIPRRLDLRKVYIEITNRCNLNCRMCFRNFWDSPLGEMPFEGFREIIGQLREFPDIKTIYLGGIGEPTIHPDFIRMVRLVRDEGYSLEFGTNGTTLSQMADALVDYGVEKIMISIDAPEEAVYRDIRGTEFAGVVDNVKHLKKQKDKKSATRPEVGIEAVIMKSNIRLLHGMMPLAFELGVNHIMFSNIMPFDSSLSDEIIYDGSVDYRLFIEDLSADIGKYRLRLEFPKFNLQTERICKFIESRSTVIRWDGEVAPCYRFLHSYTEYVFGRQKGVVSHSFGNVFTQGLSNIWTGKAYQTFRYTVKNALYPSCTDCPLRDVCDFAKDTEYDCWGNHPSCADCLWARGLIQCP